jgi:hypothetical protein
MFLSMQNAALVCVCLALLASFDEARCIKMLHLDITECTFVPPCITMHIYLRSISHKCFYMAPTQVV